MYTHNCITYMYICIYVYIYIYIYIVHGRGGPGTFCHGPPHPARAREARRLV